MAMYMSCLSWHQQERVSEEKGTELKAINNRVIQNLPYSLINRAENKVCMNKPLNSLCEDQPFHMKQPSKETSTVSLCTIHKDLHE